jgi:hypothetical protein
MKTLKNAAEVGCRTNVLANCKAIKISRLYSTLTCVDSLQFSFPWLANLAQKEGNSRHEKARHESAAKALSLADNLAEIGAL